MLAIVESAVPKSILARCKEVQGFLGKATIHPYTIVVCATSPSTYIVPYLPVEIAENWIRDEMTLFSTIVIRGGFPFWLGCKTNGSGVNMDNKTSETISSPLDQKASPDERLFPIAGAGIVSRY